MALKKEENPLDRFGRWIAEAAEKEPYDHTAVALATVDASGMPNVRMVLLKAWGEDGFVFYTNANSTKGQEIEGAGKAALCFHWRELARQVRVRGTVAPIDDEEADAYFASRDRGSRIGAWASNQSHVLESRFALEKAVAKYAAKFGMGEIPRPPHWTGYRLRPFSIEYWVHRDHRLHDRLLYEKVDGGPWQCEWLYP